MRVLASTDVASQFCTPALTLATFLGAQLCSWSGTTVFRERTVPRRLRFAQVEELQEQAGSSSERLQEAEQQLQGCQEVAASLEEEAHSLRQERDALAQRLQNLETELPQQVHGAQSRVAHSRRAAHSTAWSCVSSRLGFRGPKS